MTASSRWLTPLASVEERLARAASVTGFGRYINGAGGFHPEMLDPQDSHWDPLKKHRGRGLDCSGFLFWCWGVARKQRLNGKAEHMDTSWLVRDARGAQRRVMLVAPESIQPGDGVVYGDWLDKRGKRREGHCGLVIAPPPGGLGSKFNRMRVVHCSLGNDRSFGYAIAETDGQAFNGGKDTVFVRPLP